MDAGQIERPPLGAWHCERLLEKLDGGPVPIGGNCGRSERHQGEPRGQRGDIRLLNRRDVRCGLGVTAGANRSLNQIHQNVENAREMEGDHAGGTHL